LLLQSGSAGIFAMKLEVLEVKKRYGAVQAVDGVSLSVSPGRIYGLLGPNGAGKTTTIRMIMNIIAPDQGQILFDGKPIRPVDKNRIGYLPEERGLYRKMVLNELLHYFASLKARRRGEVQERIDGWLERFDLSDWQLRKVEHLSKGMRQKVQFIVSVLHDPDILVLDEPFAGLDPLSTEQLRMAVLDLGRQGKTIVLSTHIMEQAERMCSSILIIDHGREVLSGSVDGIKRRFGSNSVIVEFEGDAAVLQHCKLTGDVISYPRWVEAELAPGVTADELLAYLVGKVSIKRFEVLAPSLNKIFIDQLRKDEEGG
jgi:ABC-2 type transport system ATP-binding protein